MSTTLNHLVLSRTRLAEASELADAGSATLARTRLLSAADHALIALAGRSAVAVPASGDPLDRFTIALRLTELGAAPEEAAPLLRDLDDEVAQDRPSTELTPGLGMVQALIDASLDQPAPGAAARMPLYGGARGAVNARGAEAAARGLARLAGRVRGALRR
jgi:hypothetical protein